MSSALLPLSRSRRRLRVGVVAVLNVLSMLVGLGCSLPAHANVTSSALDADGADVRGDVSTLTAPGSLSVAEGIAVIGGYAYTADRGQIVRINLGSGVVRPVAGSAAESGCQDGATGADSRFSYNIDDVSDKSTFGYRFYTEQYFTRVVGTDGRLVYVRDLMCGAIRTVDPVTGRTRTLTGLDVGVAKSLAFAQTVAVTADKLYVYDQSDCRAPAGVPCTDYNSVVEYDLATGIERTLAYNINLDKSSGGAIVADDSYVWLLNTPLVRVDRRTGQITRMPYSGNLDNLIASGNYWGEMDGQVVSVGNYLYFTTQNGQMLHECLIYDPSYHPNYPCAFYPYLQIRRMNKDTGEIQDFAGGATDDAVDGIGADATFGSVNAMAASNGSLYVADTPYHHVTGSIRVARPVNAPSPVTPAGKPFIYVALGDSYQSGEGVGMGFSNADTYRAQAYENGANYPAAVGGQVDTYTPGYTHGSGCHRALANYPKLAHARLEPGRKVILIDVTCSGAKIEPGGKPPVVGAVGSDPLVQDPESQLLEAKRRLASIGYTLADVDLVTVGMGGNDAKFSDIVMSCLAPTLLRRALAAYPNAPVETSIINLPGIRNLLSCKNIDALVVKSGDAINALSAKEVWAQSTLLQFFPQARILQLNYPDILPAKATAPSWCGGISRDDLDFAHQRIAQIDAVVDDTARNASADSRYQLVDVQNGFGPNALCPATDQAALANGLQQSDFDAALNYLLNLDGTGDTVARQDLDQVVDNYKALRDCVLLTLGLACQGRLDTLKASFNTLSQHLVGVQDKIVSYLVPPMLNDTTQSSGDRVPSLFHPNAKGAAVLACYVEMAYLGIDPQGSCLSGTDSTTTLSTMRTMQALAIPVASAPDTVNGAAIGNAPISVLNGTRLHLRTDAWDIDAAVQISLDDGTAVGTHTANSDGVLDVTVTAPAATAGVHTLVMSGTTTGGTAMEKHLRLDYTGRPVPGDTYATYLTGFTPATATATDDVDITYNDFDMGTLSADEDGGVLVQVPVADPATVTGPLTITAHSASTGKTTTVTINPLPAGTTVPVIAQPGTQASPIGAPTSLTLSASDGASPYTWAATGLPAGLSLNATTGVVSGTPTTTATATVTLTAIDANQVTGTAVFGWNTGTPPVLANPGAQVTTAGTMTSLGLSTSSGNAPYTWTATGLPGGLTIDTGTGIISGTPTRAGTSTVTATVIDNLGLTATATFSWKIPVAIANPGTQASATGVATSLTLSASGGTNPYAWTATGLPSGLTLDAATGVVSGTPTAPTTATVTVTALDANQIAGSTTFTWNTGPAPVVTNPGTITSPTQVAVSRQLSASGGTGPYTWSATGLPAGLAINSTTGLVTGTPTTAGSTSVTVKAVDSRQIVGSTTFKWKTGVVVGNPGTRGSAIGVATSLTLSATGGTSPYTWTATGLPAGLTLNTTTGVVSGTPTAAGAATVTITAMDTQQVSGSATFTWNTGTPAIVANPGTLTSPTGVALSQPMSATGGTSPYTWTATGLPAGLTISGTTGVISGTPTTSGTATVTITATDSQKLAGSTTFTWQTGIVVASPGTQGSATGVATSLTLAATGGTKPYTWTATDLPVGLTINNTTGVISGTPTAAGTATVTVTAKDTKQATGTATFTWYTGAAPTVAGPGALASPTGVMVSQPMTATGGTGPYTWTATGLPAGLTINGSTGLVTGTPTTAATTTVTITIVDSHKITGSTSFSWRTGVVVANPGTLSSATGAALSQPMSATGGTSPYTWTATGLPSGLTINTTTGIISGTPTAAGTATVTVTAKDTKQVAGSVTFTWKTGVVVTDPGTRGSATGVSTSLTMSASGGTKPYTWTATGLPSGLTINTTTGIISGTPTAVGTATVTVTAKDTKQVAGSVTFTWNTGTAPVVTNPGTPTNAHGVALSRAMTATGGTSPYTWTATGLPAGLTIDSGTGVISGTPTTAGTATVTVTVTDSRKIAGKSTFTWKIT